MQTKDNLFHDLPESAIPTRRHETRCAICSVEIEHPADSPPICQECTGEYPAALLKACTDCPFDYSLGLKNGQVIMFSGATIHGDWVHLDIEGHVSGYSNTNRTNWITTITGMPFARGIDVRLSEIAWIADCPQGS